VLATPKTKDGPFQSVRVGFKAKDLAAIEITDSFGQHSMLVFNQMTPNAPIPAESFKFVVPKGADVMSSSAQNSKLKPAVNCFTRGFDRCTPYDALMLNCSVAATTRRSPATACCGRRRRLRRSA
jgi:hypothetical protein